MKTVSEPASSPGGSDSRDPRVIVAGDGCVDWLDVKLPPTQDGPNEDHLVWQTSPGLLSQPLPGDALLTAHLVRMAVEGARTTEPWNDLGHARTQGMLCAHFTVDRFPGLLGSREDARTAYRIREYRGFVKGESSFPPLDQAAGAAELVVLDDGGNGFRYAEQAWPAALREPGEPLVLYKMGRPIGRGPLWDALRAAHAERMIVALNAEDLRREGINISRRLSWERTATDLVWHLAFDSRLAQLRDCAHLVVRFGADGAILCTRADAWLFFDTEVGEDGSAEAHPGRMRGLGSAFAAALAAHLRRDGCSRLSEGVRSALRSSRRLLEAGYGEHAERLGYPGPELFDGPRPHERPFTEFGIPAAKSPHTPDPNFWCISNQLPPETVRQAAHEVVALGVSAALDRVPAAVFGELRTVDRSEIESFRAIQNLLREYVAAPHTNRPLSIAVFGPPGAGKSFAVSQVASTVQSARLERLGFDLSQFDTVRALATAFHRTRDVSLRGNLPFVFFDEFDADYHGPLGWLKYFLAPMQAGRFRDRDGMHPLGRGVLVFAGGTASTFADFCCGPGGSTAGSAEEAAAAAATMFRNAKGPDFVSRLRGHVNVRGVDAEGAGDHLFLLRRALLVRAQLHQKAAHLFDGRGACQIDAAVLRALLEVPAYRHGARSVSAIIEMSGLAGRKRFERASLPPSDQLSLHVDARAFMRLVTPPT